MNWINFQDTIFVSERLSSLPSDAKPVFGKMNVQQMIEHLGFVTRLANGDTKLDFEVSPEKSAKRKPFLDSDQELFIGFKAPFVGDEPLPTQFESIDASIQDLVIQIHRFEEVFTEAPERTVMHPFFGALDYDYWKKFQIKHFTHHFKQFELL